MGANLAPILANIYMAMLEEELKTKCKNKNIKWPIMFKRFIDDGFGIMRGNKKDVESWIYEFNQLRENIFIDKWTFGNHVAYMDLYIFKGNNFFDTGILSIKVYQKPENRYMYIPYKSAHPRHTIKNYVLGELKRYVRINTEELNYQKIKNSFFLRMRNRGFHKNMLANWFSQVKYSNRAKFLDDNPDDTCYYQGTRETLADTTLIKIRETILKETLSTDTREAAEVVSEDKDTEVSKEASTCRTVLFSKGSLYKRVAYPLLNAKNEKTKNLCLYDCYLFRQQEQRKVVLFIPRGQSWKFEKKSTRYSRTNSVYSAHRKQWKKFLKTSTSAQIINNKQSLKIMW